MRAEKICKLSLGAVFVAFIAVCSWICIYLPSGMPLTLQIFAISLSGFLLGIKWGTMSVISYILLGAVGIPVFSSFTGGISYISGPTGGFILGFIPLAFSCGAVSGIKNKALKLIIPFIGLIICHAFGFLYYSIVTRISPILAFLTSSAPYIIKDIILIFGAFLLTLRLKKLINSKI